MSDPYFKNKVIMITGASSGIGLALARRLLENESHLILISRQIINLEKQFSSCHNCLIFQQDITDTSGIYRCIDIALERYQRIDLIILNSGISQRDTFLNSDLETFHKIMATNFNANLHIVKKILPIMQQQSAGQIVATSSIFAHISVPRRTAYCSSKAALRAFFNALRNEINHKHIKINLISPASIDTPIAINALDAHGKPYNCVQKKTIFRMDVDTCINKIIKAIKANRHDAIIGHPVYKLCYFLERVMPGCFYTLLNKFYTRR